MIVSLLSIEYLLIHIAVHQSKLSILHINYSDIFIEAKILCEL